jgi:thiamine-phosphate diphosphorylase
MRGKTNPPRQAAYVCAFAVLLLSPAAIGFILHSSVYEHGLTKSHRDGMDSFACSRWKDPPKLAVLTEPDACDSVERLEDTYNAVERATRDGHVDLVVIRTSDDTNDASSTTSSRNDIKFELMQRLSQLKLIRDEHGVGFKLVINNDVEMLINALSHGLSIDGIHVKEKNIGSIPTIRKQLQDLATQAGIENQIIIGTSCHLVESAMSSYQHVDYLFVGTCYMTKSHPEKNQEQLEGPMFPGRIKEVLSRVCDSSSLPLVFAIGGIDETNCREPVSLGADGVGVIRSVMKASDPRQMAECIVESMTNAMQRVEGQELNR